MALLLVEIIIDQVFGQTGLFLVNVQDQGRPKVTPPSTATTAPVT
jgi:hypothetical protein